MSVYYCIHFSIFLCTLSVYFCIFLGYFSQSQSLEDVEGVLLPLATPSLPDEGVVKGHALSHDSPRLLSLRQQASHPPTPTHPLLLSKLRPLVNIGLLSSDKGTGLQSNSSDLVPVLAQSW